MDEFKNQPNLKPYFDSAYGYAVFESIAKGGIGIGGATGKGGVYVNNKNGTERRVGTTQMFQSEKDFQNFTSGNFEFGADANVVALTASASAKATTLGVQGLQTGMKASDIQIEKPMNTEYTKGMAVFSVTKGGLMYQATVSGQKFNYHADV